QRVVRAIQVSYEVKENREREINGLLEAMDAFKLKEGLIITEDREEEERIDGREIVYMPLWKWLLNV
ncbi:MAG: ATP-binding protein, partial [Candidatus Methanoperedens sp.]|nr:ATP-binding protein [Candidatus Methanoperedens sp.]